MSTVTRSRAESVAEAHRLRAQGLKIREIAELLHVKRSTAGSYLTDPDLRKLRDRKRRYGGTCPHCGAPRDGSAGFKTREDSLCQECRSAEPHSVERARRSAWSQPKWTNEQVLAALQIFYRRYGTCTNVDYRNHPSSSRPSSALVIMRFGSWRAALEAADLPIVGCYANCKRLGPDDCVNAVKRAAEVLGAVPSIATYEALRRDRPDLKLPSAAVIRLRCRTWLAALEAAFSDTTERLAA